MGNRKWFMVRLIAPIAVVFSLFSFTMIQASPWKIYGSGVAEKKTARRIALIIGIDRFDDVYWPDLKYAAKDALDLSSALSAKESLFDQIILLNDAKHTDKDTILKSLDQVILDNRREEDTVLVYVSTHGTIDQNPVKGEFEQFLIAKNTFQTALTQTAIPLELLYRKFSLLKSKRKVLIIASCYSGIGKSKYSQTIKKKLVGVKGPPVFIPLYEVSEAAIILSASRLMEPAREDSRLKNDIYTHFFIQALRDKKVSDKDKDGATSALEAHDFAKELTYLYTKGSQVPTAFVKMAGLDPIILIGSKTVPSNPILYAYSKQFLDYSIYANGEKKGSLPGTISFDPGTYNIEVRSDTGQTVYNETMTLKSDSRLTVAKLIEPPVHHLGIESGAVYPLSAVWREDTEITLSKQLGLVYTRDFFLKTQFPFQLKSAVNYSFASGEELDNISDASSSFNKLDLKIAGAINFFKYKLLKTDLAAGAGWSHSQLKYSFGTSDIRDQSWDPLFFAGLALSVQITKHFALNLQSELSYTHLTYTLFETAHYFAQDLHLGFEARF